MPANTRKLCQRTNRCATVNLLRIVKTCYTDVHEKLPDNATNFVFSCSTKIPRKTHENRQNVRKCFERNDSEPRKNPQKFHEISTKNSTNAPLIPKIVALRLAAGESCRISQNFVELRPSDMCKGCKKTPVYIMKAPCNLLSKTRPQSNKLVKRAVFHTGSFHMFCGLPIFGNSRAHPSLRFCGRRG